MKHVYKIIPFERIPSAADQWTSLRRQLAVGVVLLVPLAAASTTSVVVMTVFRQARFAPWFYLAHTFTMVAAAVAVALYLVWRGIERNLITDAETELIMEKAMAMMRAVDGKEFSDSFDAIKSINRIRWWHGLPALGGRAKFDLVYADSPNHVQEVTVLIEIEEPS